MYHPTNHSYNWRYKKASPNNEPSVNRLSSVNIGSSDNIENHASNAPLYFHFYSRDNFPKMGKADAVPKKNPIRRYKRAHLTLPTHIVRRQLKAKMPDRRFQKEVEIVVTALLEHSLERLLLTAAGNVTKGSYIDSQHVHTAINDKTSDIYGVFPKNVPGVF